MKTTNPPRSANADNAASPSGTALVFGDPPPWHKPVDGARLVDDLVRLFARYVVLREHCAEALAVWVLHSWTCEEAADFSPRLGVVGPTKRSGKSRVLEVLGGVVRRALPVAHATAASLFRTIDKYRPTTLIDEGDTFLKDNHELRGILNSGQRRGGQVTRCSGDNYEPRVFGVFAPVAVALIGRLPETVEDRAVVIAMQRKRPEETVERLRFRDFKRETEPLRRRLARWALDHFARLRAARPDLPVSLNDRAADGWEPLLAIADEIGGLWPRKIRRAAITLSGDGAEDDSVPVLLLGDSRGIFDQLDLDRIASDELCNALGRMAERPWAEWGRSKGRITQGAVARILRGFRIRSRSIRLPGGENLKGYRRSDFEDAFARYLPSPKRHSVTGRAGDVVTSREPQDSHPRTKTMDRLRRTMALAKAGRRKRRGRAS